MHCARGGERHPGRGRKRRHATFSRVSRVFDTQLRVFALEGCLMRERAPDSGVQLEHDELHRDYPDQRESKQTDPYASANQPVEQRTGGERFERTDRTQSDAGSRVGRAALAFTHRDTAWLEGWACWAMPWQCNAG